MKANLLKSLLFYIGICILLLGITGCKAPASQEINKIDKPSYLLKTMIDSVNNYHREEAMAGFREEQIFNLKIKMQKEIRAVYKRYEKQLRDLEQKNKQIEDSLGTMN